MNKVYEQIKLFKKKYPHTITWFRLKKHSEIVSKHLNPNEEPIYSFAAQKNDNMLDIFSTCVVTLTNRRILIGQDHILVGYTLSAITPDLFNDLEVYEGILWGKVTIDTIKEVVILTNIDKRALTEIETAISSFMMEEKKKYKNMEDINA